LSKFQSKNLKASLLSSTRVLFSDKACGFRQSERMLYENFIINSFKQEDNIEGKERYLTEDLKQPDT